MYVYSISYAVGFILGVALLIGPFLEVLKLSRQAKKGKKQEDNEEKDNEEDFNDEYDNTISRYIPEL
ncbi:hypothetical protein TVAG_143340 [Trichomonas vaginalis G3]|uniref:Uncharacterized protein n=1 Tax=Trichomonas vaginalis (strain ATCC PRA-98 / G3) TaxID=412133 RepID=A2EWD0_TRIV3|nr:hypothetical protein TVAGG3_0353370 [Trichomonas vaginalis G3]EAY03034.1 hypothetical protein TVAG_143340 [Trichomonas vaginalis G3]KAI5531457.1 hypothetical protein TVAGG3_0353370 [Trichomonas vaginalis G3]|eukprot:XP_001315257.1 hypothetical protein [Trichomonas vaginalis G3]